MNKKYNSLFDLWEKSCKSFGNNILFSDNSGTKTITYNEAFRQVCFLSHQLKNYGISRLDHISLFAVNSPNWLILEEAIICSGATCVAKTSELGINELEYVYTNSDSCALITDNYEIIEAFQKDIPDFSDKVKFVIYTGEKNISDLNSKIYSLRNILSDLKEDTVINTQTDEKPDDIAYISYTSGTSSNPKGAMLPNGGMAYVVEELQKFNDIKEGKTFIVTFPLSSAGGKSFNLLCLSEGCRIVYTPYKEFYETIEKFNPDYLHCAPKIIQTVHSKLMSQVEKKGKFFKFMFDFAYFISSKILKFERKYLYNGKKLYLKNIINQVKKIIDKSVYKSIRNTLFKDDITIFVGSAHLAKPLEDFLQIMNINHVQHFGLTETTGLDISNTVQSQKEHPYTVGIPFSNTVVRIVDPEAYAQVKREEVGLITLKGPEILKGYYKNEEATKKALLEFDFLNTGDLGYIDKDGYLVVLSRYDDVIVLSNGYNVYTPLLENETKDSQYVQQLVITGHGKPYLTSLIVLNDDEYKKWCSENNISDNLEPNNNKPFKDFLIEHLNEKLKRKKEYRYYEKIKKVYFLKEGFSAENGMLTGTLKIKYRKVVNTYKNIIDSLYDEDFK